MFKRQNLGWVISTILLIVLLWGFFSYKDQILAVENTTEEFYIQIDSLESRINYLDSVNTVYLRVVEEKDDIIKSVDEQRVVKEKSLVYLRRKIQSLNTELKNKGLEEISLDSIPIYWSNEFRNYMK